jgi:hypothetical protein
VTKPKAKGAAKGGRPRRAVTQLVCATGPDGTTPRKPRPNGIRPGATTELTLYDSTFLGALKAWMLNELADDPEESAVVEGAFAQLEAEDETTSGTSKARARSSSKPRRARPEPGKK